MDNIQSMALGSLISFSAGILAWVIKLNHHRVRSKCCNRDCTTSIDVEETTPVDNGKIIPPP